MRLVYGMLSNSWHRMTLQCSVTHLHTVNGLDTLSHITSWYIQPLFLKNYFGNRWSCLPYRMSPAVVLTARLLHIHHHVTRVKQFRQPSEGNSKLTVIYCNVHENYVWFYCQLYGWPIFLCLLSSCVFACWSFPQHARHVYVVYRLILCVVCHSVETLVLPLTDVRTHSLKFNPCWGCSFYLFISGK